MSVHVFCLLFSKVVCFIIVDFSPYISDSSFLSEMYFAKLSPRVYFVFSFWCLSQSKFNKIQPRAFYMDRHPFAVVFKGFITKCDIVHMCQVPSVVSHSVRPCGLQHARPLCPWDSPGKNTWVGCHALLQGIVLTQGSNPHLLCWHS